jgi:hypothetical protein
MSFFDFYDSFLAHKFIYESKLKAILFDFNQKKALNLSGLSTFILGFFIFDDYPVFHNCPKKIGFEDQLSELWTVDDYSLCLLGIY